MEPQCTQWFHDHFPHLLDILRTSTDFMELALLATALPEAFALCQIESPGLPVGFREGVRDRYGALIEEDIRPASLTR